MQNPIVFSIDEQGDVKFLVSDATRPFLDETSKVQRASHVEPWNIPLRWAFYAIRKVCGEYGKMAEFTRKWPCYWRVNLSPVGGPIVPVEFANRDSAIEFEVDWLNHYFL